MEKKIARNRPSAVRDRIMEILTERKEALAHKDFQEMFQEKWDRVTIYRALDKLIADGKIHKVTGLEGVVQYALCHECETHAHQHDHVHFNCLNCHKVVCIEGIVPILELPAGFTINEIQCMVSGICPDCKKNNAPTT